MTTSGEPDLAESINQCRGSDLNLHLFLNVGPRPQPCRLPIGLRLLCTTEPEVLLVSFCLLQKTFRSGFSNSQVLEWSLRHPSKAAQQGSTSHCKRHCGKTSRGIARMSWQLHCQVSDSNQTSIGVRTNYACNWNGDQNSLRPCTSSMYKDGTCWQTAAHKFACSHLRLQPLTANGLMLHGWRMTPGVGASAPAATHDTCAEQ